MNVVKFAAVSQRVLNQFLEVNPIARQPPLQSARAHAQRIGGACQVKAAILH